ncbi:hypothetical protein [Rhizorhapis sp.]|uniref:hypothetical protein n=1 Tax=Rhizorhapis sp. TaxID=1968842 RepID=UPI002B46D3D3|nr:hypothetical protein [Rhizorhapis sp.]HKR18502.1 hypothetical protein [Rhizorhapis sp.]
MKRIFSAALMMGCMAFSAPVEAAKKPKLSGLELQQIQSKDFEVGKDVSFPAVMSVLQDEGYRILSADKDTGLITGQGSSKGKLTYNILWGFGNKKRSPVVSAFIESVSENVSRIRLSFVMAVTKGGIYGQRSADEEPITDAAAYTDAFEKISKAIFVRQAMDSSGAGNVPVPATDSSISPTSQPVAATKAENAGQDN